MLEKKPINRDADNAHDYPLVRRRRTPMIFDGRPRIKQDVAACTNRVRDVVHLPSREYPHTFGGRLTPTTSMWRAVYMPR
jgi:hypothetical protein